MHERQELDIIRNEESSRNQQLLNCSDMMTNSVNATAEAMVFHGIKSILFTFVCYCMMLLTPYIAEA